MAGIHESVWKRRAGWWSHNRRYVLFMLREIGGSLTAVYGIALLFLLVEFNAGRDAYDAYLALLQSPLVLVLTGIAFFFILVHAFTWFYLIGKSQPVMSKYRSPSWDRIFVLMLVLFAVISVGVLYVVFGGL